MVTLFSLSPSPDTQNLLTLCKMLLRRAGPSTTRTERCPSTYVSHCPRCTWGSLCCSALLGKTGSVKILVLPHTLCLQCWDVLPAVPKASSSNSLVLSSCLEWWGRNPGAGTARALSGDRSGSLMLQSGRKSRTRCVPDQYSV